MSAPRVYVEPWPAGGWAVWIEGDPAPVSRHDTEEEAAFKAAAYRRALVLGRQPLTSAPPRAGGAARPPR